MPVIRPLYTVGDYNTDLMQINVNQNFRKYLNDILSTSTKCAIDLPTRVTDGSRTLLDHVYVNDLNTYTLVEYSYAIWATICLHLFVFLPKSHVLKAQNSF